MALTRIGSRIAPATATRRAALGAAAGLAAFGLGRRSRSASAQSTPATLPPIVERWAAAWNANDPAATASRFTDDGLSQDLAFGASFRGQDGVVEGVAITASVIPDAAVEPVAAFRAGNRVAVEWIFTGSRIALAESPGPTTGETFAVRAASVFESEGDLIRRVSDYYNPTTLRAQTGQAAPAGPTGAEATPSV